MSFEFTGIQSHAFRKSTFVFLQSPLVILKTLIQNVQQLDIISASVPFIRTERTFFLGFGAEFCKHGGL